MEKPWEVHERVFASNVPGGEQVVGSGNYRERMDVQTDRSQWYWRFLYSLKSTTRKSIPITRAVWREVEDAAYERGPEMRPAIGLRLVGSSRDAHLDLVVVEMHDWSELLWELDRYRSAARQVSEVDAEQA